MKSNNSYKVILVLVVALLVAYHLFHYEYLLIAAFILALIGIFSEGVSGKIAFLWMWFAEITGKFMPKIILGVLYFIFFVPYALICRSFKTDLLDIKNKEPKTLYKERDHLYTADDITHPW